MRCCGVFFCVSSFVLVQRLTEYETFTVVCAKLPVGPGYRREKQQTGNVHVEKQGPSSAYVDVCDVKSAPAVSGCVLVFG